MNLELLRPKALKHPDGIFIFSIYSIYEFEDPILKVKIAKSIRTITTGKFGIPGQNINVDLDHPPKEQLSLYSSMQSFIKSCVDNAEDIKDKLLSALTNPMFKLSDLKKDEYMRMSFMKLKNYFMNDILETKIYKDFNAYNSTVKLKPIWKMFDSFIEDRNKYTHGHLCFMRPSFDLVIEYIDTKTNSNVSARIDKAVLLSYNNCFLLLKDFIDGYNTIHNQRLLSKGKKQDN